MKTILIFVLFCVISFSAFSFEPCTPGEIKFLGHVDATVTAVAHDGQIYASIREQLFPIVDASDSLNLGDPLSGALFCRCVDIGHIPGRQTYWSKFIVEKVGEDQEL